MGKRNAVIFSTIIMILVIATAAFAEKKIPQELHRRNTEVHDEIPG
ncbi:MAG: hypothetical protein AB2L14_16980 [Candidatus Xenobiia bacterium LiM19]